MGPVKSRLRRSQANRQASHNPNNPQAIQRAPFLQSVEGSHGKSNLARSYSENDVQTGNINISLENDFGNVVDDSLQQGRRTPTTSPRFSADDYLTDEQFQFVKDNIGTVRPKGPNANLLFYKKKLIPKPLPGHTIVEILKMKGNYDLLKEQLKHIQWLFPTPNASSRNPHSHPLQPHEAKAIKGSRELKARFLETYKLMLDYYGMKLDSKRTGEVVRGDGWRSRYSNLSGNSKEYMRITRILTSLGCLGFASLQLPWVTFMIKEIYITQQLRIPLKSVQFWIAAISDESEKFACEQFLDTFTSPHGASPPLERRMDFNREIQHWGQDVNGSDSCFSVGASYNPTAPPLGTEPVLTSNEFLTDNEFDFIQTGGYEFASNRPSFTSESQQTGADQAELSGVTAEQNDESKVCKICLEEQVEVAFVPCGHVMACSSCACMLKNCAICRSDIEKVMRIYLS